MKNILTEVEKLIIVIRQAEEAQREFNKAINELKQKAETDFPKWDQAVKRGVKDADGILYRLRERKALYYRGFSITKAINYQLG